MIDTHKAKKVVYFVRHGQSEENTTDIVADGSSPLTDLGRRQATFVAERLHALPVSLVAASTMERAKATAEIIATRLHKEVMLSDLFRERRMPTSVIGLHIHSDEAKRVAKECATHFEDLAWHYEDEENFADLKERALNAWHWLSEREESHIVVVTHGKFLRYLMGTLFFDDLFTPDQYRRLNSHMVTRNTGITVCMKDAPPHNHWRLLAWNDHAHLGEVQAGEPEE